MVSYQGARGIAAALVIGSACARACAGDDTPTVHWIGFYPGGDLTIPRAVSADGRVVTGWGYGLPGGPRAFRWTFSGGLHDIGLAPSGRASYGRDVSGDGQVVVGEFDDPVSRALRWTPSGGFQNLGLLPGASYSHAFGCSLDGSVVVGESREPFRWSAATGMQSLGTLGGAYGTAYGVSGDGNIVVGDAESGSGRQGFRWTAATGMLPLLSTPVGSHASAFGISDDGSTIIGYQDIVPGYLQSCRWLGETADLLLPGEPGVFQSVARAVSADGSVIVGEMDMAVGTRAFIWTEQTGMRDLTQMLIDQGVDLQGRSLQFATGVSADGNVIAGYSRHDQLTEGWVVAIPSPGAATLVLTIACVGIRRRR